MASIMPLVQQMLMMRMAGGGGHSSPSSLAGGVAMTAVSVAMTVMGLAFALYAGNLWLMTFLPPEIAAISTAGVAFVLALVSAMIGKAVATRKKRHVPATAPSDVTHIISNIINALGDELDDPIRENPKTAIMLASLAGFVAGEHRA